MEIVRHSKRDAARFDHQWRAALRERSFLRRRLVVSDISTWQVRARLGITFAHDAGSVSGNITFDDRELTPHPSEICEVLKLDSVWFFGDAYAWAIHTGHEDWDLAELFEQSTDVES
jgi:hypothetical protein